MQFARTAACTGTVIRGMTPALSLRCTSSQRLPTDWCIASLRICTLLLDQPESVGQFCYEPYGEYPSREFNVLNHSREFNMLACLLAALASGSFARFHCDVCSIPFLFLPSSKTVSLRCSFCFHVDSNRATPHASNESRLSASRDIRSMRIAVTIPCQ